MNTFGITVECWLDICGITVKCWVDICGITVVRWVDIWELLLSAKWIHVGLPFNAELIYEGLRWMLSWIWKITVECSVNTSGITVECWVDICGIFAKTLSGFQLYFGRSLNGYQLSLIGNFCWRSASVRTVISPSSCRKSWRSCSWWCSPRRCSPRSWPSALSSTRNSPPYTVEPSYLINQISHEYYRLSCWVGKIVDYYYL